MRRHPVTMTVAAAAVVGTALLTGPGAAGAGTRAPAAARAAVSTGTWGTAQEVPGSATLNKNGKADISTVSCASVGNCGAGGFYKDVSAHQQAMVVDQSSGTWGTAQEAPGTAALNACGRAGISSASCRSAGNCSACGYYTDSTGHTQALVIDESSGTWGSAEQVPGTAALNLGSSGTAGATILSVSCATAGNCSAGGYYTDGSGLQQAFVVGETNGTWGTAQEVPGTAGLNAGGYAAFTSVSCPAAGKCSGGGYYASSSNSGIPTVQAFVIRQVNGSWLNAGEVPGTAAMNGGGYAQTTSVSCASAGNCSAGGQYTNSRPATEVFVVNETNGTWRTAKEVPGIWVLNKRLLAQIYSLSCASPGNCSAGGFYQDASFVNQPFVVNETNGTWGTAMQVPGIPALNKISPGSATVTMSCGGAGNCDAGGFYTDSSGGGHAFVVSETNGTWGAASEVPGTAALNAGLHAGIESISCAAAGSCSAGGFYTDSKLATQAFVVSSGP